MQIGMILFISFVVAKSADAAITIRPAFNLGLVGYWSFDEGLGVKAGDMSGKGNVGSLGAGSSTPAWVDGKRGRALSFDGTNDNVIVSDDDSLDLESDFTISAWVLLNQLPITDEYPMIISKRIASPLGVNYELLSHSGLSGAFHFQAYTSSTWYSASGSLVPVANTWYHVAGVKSGTQMFLYVNGLQNGTGTAPVTIVTNDQPVFVGKASVGAASGDYNFPGLIDEVHIYNRALSAGEVGRLYNLTKPKIMVTSDMGLVGYWSMDEGQGTKVGDMSGNGKNGTASGGPAWISGKRGQALSFDGSSDYVTGFNDYISSVGSRSVCVWAKSDDPSRRQGIIGDRPMVENQGFAFHLNGANTVRYYHTGGSTLNISTTVNANQWYYWCVTLDAPAATVTIYKDGSNVGSSSSFSTQTVSSFKGIIGSESANVDSGELFKGFLDEVRIYNRVLSATEVAGLYTSSKKIIKVNASQNTKMTDGLVGLWTFNGQDVAGNIVHDRSSNGNNGTIIGATLDSGKVGQALSFDGSTQKVTATDTPSLSITGYYTISAWINPDSLPTSGNFMSIVSKYDTTSNPGGYDLRLYNNSGTQQIGLTNYRCCFSSGGGDINYTLATNSWQHLVGVYDGIDSIIYVNGSEINSIGNTVSPSDNTKLLNIGNFGWYGVLDSELSRYFDGRIDEVRVYNRALSAAEVKRLYNLGK